MVQIGALRRDKAKSWFGGENSCKTEAPLSDFQGLLVKAQKFEPNHKAKVQWKRIPTAGTGVLLSTEEKQIPNFCE